MKNIIAATAAVLTMAALSGCDTASLGAEEKNDTPTAIKAGAAFTHDKFKAKAGWKVVREPFGGGANIKGLRVTNSGGDQRIAQLTFRFYKKKNVLAEVECSSNEMQKGETSALDCFSLDSKFPIGYTTIKVADMW